VAQEVDDYWSPYAKEQRWEQDVARSLDSGFTDKQADHENGHHRRCERQQPATEQASASPEKTCAWGDSLALRPCRSGDRRNEHVPESAKDGTDHCGEDDLVGVNPFDRRHPQSGGKCNDWSRSDQKDYHYERDNVIPNSL